MNDYKTMILDKTEVDKVKGEIYVITNTITNKSYVGQTRTHYLNHDKYRPFGYLGRFKSHISEAFSEKKNQCRYLNSTFCKHGKENFKCELLLTCEVDDLDANEIKYVAEYKSKFPTGYNLTDGGQGINYLNNEKVVLDNSLLVKPPPKVRDPASLKRSEYTRGLMSQRGKDCKGTEENRLWQMGITQKQHYENKFKVFKDVNIDETQIENYIQFRKDKNYQYIRVIINKKRTDFVGKYQTIEQLRERANNFILELIERQNHLLLETPLES